MEKKIWRGEGVRVGAGQRLDYLASKTASNPESLLSDEQIKSLNPTITLGFY